MRTIKHPTSDEQAVVLADDHCVSCGSCQERLKPGRYPLVNGRAVLCDNPDCENPATARTNSDASFVIASYPTDEIQEISQGLETPARMLYEGTFRNWLANLGNDPFAE